MLSDAEGRRLREIEDELRAEDPGFVRRMVTGPRQWHGMTARGWLLSALASAVLAVLLRSAGLAVVALSAIGVAVGLWATSAHPPR